MCHRLLRAWYQDKPSLLTRLLYPFSLVFHLIVDIRRLFYRWHLLSRCSFDVPVVVVGNITVGGTGKTPMVVYLVELLKRHGYRPGVVSRGYGGHANKPTVVDAQSEAKLVGDEALLIAKNTSVPVVVARKRCAAVKKILATTDCNVVISDDGLQHYAMQRDMEIAMIDGKRRLGNMYLLPAGPLREPVDRLRAVDAIVVTEGEAVNDEYAMQLTPSGRLISVNDPAQTCMISALQNQSVHAVAGIAHPDRFFATLSALGIEFDKQVYPDHHLYQANDFHFAGDNAIVMTEKDAVKCRSLALKNAWYLPVTAKLPSTFDEVVLKRLDEVIQRKGR